MHRTIVWCMICCWDALLTETKAPPPDIYPEERMGSRESFEASSSCDRDEIWSSVKMPRACVGTISFLRSGSGRKGFSMIQARNRRSWANTMLLIMVSLILACEVCNASLSRYSFSSGALEQRHVHWHDNRQLDGGGEDATGEDASEDEIGDQSDESNEQQDMTEGGKDETETSEESSEETTESEDDSTEEVVIDDYYAFEDDPAPPKLLPLSVYDVSGFLLASMGVTLAAGGGIGGGGILVPIYILIFEFPPRAAIPLSAITVMGGAAAATLHNLRGRHPLADRPIIDWDLILVMEPLILVGAMFGTGFHIALSEKVLVVLLVVFLSVMAHTTLTRAKKMYRAENQYIGKLKSFQNEQAARRQEEDHLQKDPSTKKKKKELLPHILLPEDEKGPSLLPDSWRPTLSTQGSTIGPNREELLILNPDYVSSLRSDLLEQEKVASGRKILAILAIFIVYVFLEIMIGGGSFDSPWGIRCGGPSFWSVHAILIGCLIASAFAAQTYLVNRHEIKELVQFDFVHGDIRWDPRTSIIYPFMFGFAGLFSGMFGIGGGMVTVPLLFTMGVHPMVATATSSVMTLFTSFSASVSFAIFGLYLWDYALVCMLVGFFAAYFGQKIMRRARKAGNSGNFERTSMIAFSIGGLILLSAFLMTIQYLYQIFVGYEENDSGGLCEGYRYHRVSS